MKVMCLVVLVWNSRFCMLLKMVLSLCLCLVMLCCVWLSFCCECLCVCSVCVLMVDRVNSVVVMFRVGSLVICMLVSYWFCSFCCGSLMRMVSGCVCSVW